MSAIKASFLVINLVSYLRNFYWFLGYEFFSESFNYKQLTHVGLNFIKLFSFRLILSLLVLYYFVVGIDEEIVLALLISIFGFYFYNFVFKSLVVFIEFEINSIKNLLLDAFNVYVKFLNRLVNLLTLFVYFSRQLVPVFTAVYLIFLFYLNLNFKSLSLKYLSFFNNFSFNLLKLELNNFFNYNLSSSYNIFKLQNFFNNINLPFQQSVNQSGLVDSAKEYWYNYYWTNFFLNYNFLYLNAYSE